MIGEDIGKCLSDCETISTVHTQLLDKNPHTQSQKQVHIEYK